MVYWKSKSEQRLITQACKMAQDAASENGLLEQLRKLKMEIMQMIERKHLPCILEIENNTLSMQVENKKEGEKGGCKICRISFSHQ